MICIVNYGVGNLSSIRNMLKKAGFESAICSAEHELSEASRLILPGMGHFDNCMRSFNESGLRNAIEKKVLQEKIPLLGICVGLQMLFENSEEGSEPGLNWIPGKTSAFDKSRMDKDHKIPNMGWLDVEVKKRSALMENMEEPRFYFAHSYHVQIEHGEDELLSAKYGYNFTAAVEKENIIGVQFHPEKSHRFGMQLLKNFAANYG